MIYDHPETIRNTDRYKLPKCGGELKHLGQETYQCVKCKRKFDYYA
jgi:tRNA(Ile2) C34 agmatinyltransferase TiaS